jgi:hypothetical protein
MCCGEHVEVANNTYFIAHQHLGGSIPEKGAFLDEP